LREAVAGNGQEDAEDVSEVVDPVDLPRTDGGKLDWTSLILRRSSSQT
jgi:hypothetical protein